jgi:hypothetical protein
MMKGTCQYLSMCHLNLLSESWYFRLKKNDLQGQIYIDLYPHLSYPSSLMCGPNKVNSGYIAIENSVDGKYV